MKNTVGIIGGTGFYDIPGIEWDSEHAMKTPFGEPSAKYKVGRFNGLNVVFLPRHGVRHSILPSEINFKANIYGLKALGVTRLITTSAVGSFRETLPPKHMVLVDQFVDRTKSGERHTFFGQGIIAHISFSKPTCPELRNYLYSVTRGITDGIQNGGTYLNIEGPAFSTRAESILYRSWGMDVIGMTSIAEAKLAREAEMCYSNLAIVTDFDSWHEEREEVTTSAVVENFNRAVDTAREVIARALSGFELPGNCSCQSSLQNALLTDVGSLDSAATEHLDILLKKYL